MKDKKILIVDFDEESLIALSNLVFEEGFQAVTASDGLAGYEKYKADNFDLVIIEPMLPKLHGFELCKKIKQDPVKKTPIIIVTGIYREPSCKMEALQVYGASAFFTKPWNKDDLRSKLLHLLVEGKETPVQKEAPAAAKALNSDEWGLLKTPAASREPKMSTDLDEIEKQLKEVLAGHATPSRHPKETIKEKKTPNIPVDWEIEAMLKGAIGELGLEEKKKKPEIPKPEFKRPAEPLSLKVEPAVRPTPVIKPEAWPQKEKIPIAKEIKDRLPAQEKVVNNILRTASRVHVEAEKKRFGIDQTLIEIDKIPLDLEKGRPEPEKRIAEPEKAPVEIKRPYFDEFVEPRKKKTTFAVIGGLVAVVFIATSVTFVILKSKKPGPAPKETIASLRPQLPSEFAARQNEILASQANAPKPEEKKPPTKTEPSANEIVDQVQPAVSEVTANLQIQEQPLGNPEAAQPNNEVSATPSTDTTGQPSLKEAAIPPPQETSGPPASIDPTPVKIQPGELIALNQVDTPPALLKKIEPKYPAQALNMGVEGTVTVNTLISENGDVVRTEILKGVKGDYGFERAAESAIRQWKFRPAQKGGAKVKVWKPIDINFKLSQSLKKE
jgi:TonB family protein